MNPKFTSRISIAVLLVSSVVSVTLTGCVDSQGRPLAGPGYGNNSVQVTSGYSGQDDFMYYPRYQTYYGSRSQRYYYQDGSSWVTRSAPRGVSVAALYASPSVRVDFHDSPQRHHSMISRQYPRHWSSSSTSSRGNDGRSSMRPDSRRDDDRSSSRYDPRRDENRRDGRDLDRRDDGRDEARLSPGLTPRVLNLR